MEERLQVIRQLRILYLELLKISEQQLSLLQQEASIGEVIPKLVILIDQRQKIMDNIDTMSPAVKTEQTVMEHSDLEPDLQDSALLAVYRAENAANLDLLKSVQENDKQSRPLAQALLQQSSVLLGNARKNIQALKSYAGGQRYTESWFFDRHK